MKESRRFVLGITAIFIATVLLKDFTLQKEPAKSQFLNQKQKHKNYEKNMELCHLDYSMIKPMKEIIGEIKITPTTTPTLSPEENTIDENIDYSDNRSYVAITFDDGPSKYTEELVELLDEYGIKSTFFVVGKNCENYPNALLNIYNSNHEIAIHGDTHTSFTKLSIDQVNQEINTTADYINSLDIECSGLVRPPYGSLNDNLKQNIEHPFILWNIDTEDWKTKNKDQIKAEILENIEPGAIILMHDTSAVHEVDMEVLQEILPELTQEYNFVTVSELCSKHNTNLESGKTYYKIKDNN